MSALIERSEKWHTRRYFTRKVGHAWVAVDATGRAISAGRPSEQDTRRAMQDLYPEFIWDGNWEDARD